jgi:ubiquinone/menaquinone biosynthesis C-methylase UbiE
MRALTSSSVAMLTMQGDPAKHAIVAEASRVLRPGGRYAIHELALTPETISDESKPTSGSCWPDQSQRPSAGR